MQSDSSDMRAESLRLVIKSARSTIPNTKINWETPDEPEEYYSEEVLERAIHFLQDIFALSVEENDPIDIPEIVPAPGGDITLDWDFDEYGFIFRISVDHSKPIVFVGMNESEGYNTKGEIQPDNTEKCLKLLQSCRPRYEISFSIKQYGLDIWSRKPINTKDVQKSIQKFNRKNALMHFEAVKLRRELVEGIDHDEFFILALYEFSVFLSWIFGLFMVCIDASELRITGSETPWYSHCYFQ